MSEQQWPRVRAAGLSVIIKVPDTLAPAEAWVSADALESWLKDFNEALEVVERMRIDMHKETKAP